MKILNLSVGAMIWRLHIMSAIVVVMGFLGMIYVGIIIGMVLFLLTLMGVKFKYLNPFQHTHHPSDYEWQRKHHPVHH